MLKAGNNATADKAIGMTVAQYLMYYGISRAQLGDVLGMTGQNVSARLHGRLKWNVEDLMNTANYFAIKIDDLMPKKTTNGWMPAPVKAGYENVPAPAGTGTVVAGAGFEPTTSGLLAWFITVLSRSYFFTVVTSFPGLTGVYGLTRQSGKSGRACKPGKSGVAGYCVYSGNSKVNVLDLTFCLVLVLYTVLIWVNGVMKKNINSLYTPKTWLADIEAWEQHLQAAGKAGRTITTRVRHVETLARAFADISPLELDRDTLEAWCATRQWKPETRHAYYMSFRQFFAFITGNKEGNTADILPSVRRPISLPRPVPDEVFMRAYRRANTKVKLILALAGCAGLRGHEICQLHVNDVLSTPTGNCLLVHGKAGKQRLVPLHPWLYELLMEVASGSENGFVFPGQIEGHWSAIWVGKQAKQVLPKPWTLHTLRHRFATKAYEAERDLLTVQRLLGHASVETTQRYAQPPPAAVTAAMGAVDIFDQTSKKSYLTEQKG